MLPDWLLPLRGNGRADINRVQDQHLRPHNLHVGSKSAEDSHHGDLSCICVLDLFTLWKSSFCVSPTLIVVRLGSALYSYEGPHAGLHAWEGSMPLSTRDHLGGLSMG